MNIHEYQGKELLEKYGVAVPKGRVAETAEEAEAVAKELGGDAARAPATGLSQLPPRMTRVREALSGSRSDDVQSHTPPAASPMP